MIGVSTPPAYGLKLPQAPFISSTSSDRWEDGLIVGSGVVGAIVYGGPHAHQLSVAHEEFFLPANARPQAPELASIRTEVGSALQAGDSALAQQTIDNALSMLGWNQAHLIWTDPLAPCATLTVKITEPPAESSYRRVIDPTSGLVRAEWDTTDGARLSLAVSAARGAEQMKVEISSSAPLPFTVILAAPDERRSTAETLETIDYGGRVHTSTAADPTQLRLQLSASGVEPGTSTAAKTTVRWSGLTALTPTSSTSQAMASFELPADRTVTLTVDLQIDRVDRPPTDTYGFPSPESSQSDLVNRSILDLAASWQGTTEELIAAAAHDDEAMRALIQLAYTSGRAHIIASVGALPPTLQGVWQGTWRPAWSADYTMNGNVQNGTLASVLWTGTPELLHSLFNLLRRYESDYADNAHRLFGVSGYLLPARMTTHGRANHFITDYPHQYWIGNGGWFVRFLYDYVMVTGDLDVLRTWAWEFTLAVLQFYDNVSADGVFVPSYSPENTPANQPWPLAADATMDRAVIADAARCAILLGELIGEHADTRRWQRLLDRLPDYRIASDGTLAEWIDPHYDNQPAHRHISHLYPLWYEIAPEFAASPQLRQAAHASIQQRIEWRGAEPYGPPGRMEMAFGLVQLGLAAAALGDGEQAYQCLKWLAGLHWTTALTTTHDAGAIFNLDPAGGLPAVAASMLVQSSLTELRMLPAMPRAWISGEVTGLTVRGALIVDKLRWDGHGVTVTIHSRPSRAQLTTSPVQIRLPHAVDADEQPDLTRTGDTTFVWTPTGRSTSWRFTWRQPG